MTLTDKIKICNKVALIFVTYFPIQISRKKPNSYGTIILRVNLLRICFGSSKMADWVWFLLDHILGESSVF